MSKPSPAHGPFTAAELAAVEAGMARAPGGWGCRMLANGGIAVADHEGELVFTLARRREGGIMIAHWGENPEAPEAGFRERAVADLGEALAMMRALAAEGEA